MLALALPVPPQEHDAIAEAARVGVKRQPQIRCPLSALVNLDGAPLACVACQVAVEEGGGRGGQLAGVVGAKVGKGAVSERVRWGLGQKLEYLEVGVRAE